MNDPKLTREELANIAVYLKGRAQKLKTELAETQLQIKEWKKQEKEQEIELRAIEMIIDIL